MHICYCFPCVSHAFVLQFSTPQLPIHPVVLNPVCSHLNMTILNGKSVLHLSLYRLFATNSRADFQLTGFACTNEWYIFQKEIAEIYFFSPNCTFRKSEKKGNWVWNEVRWFGCIIDMVQSKSVFSPYFQVLRPARERSNSDVLLTSQLLNSLNIKLPN